jgi:hypothetical protein
MTTTPADFRIDDAVELLEAQGIQVFEIGARARADAGEAWSELARKHGDLIAVMQPRRGELIVSWHYGHKPVAWKIRCAFRTMGMRATWEGGIENAVHVDLAPTPGMRP